MAEPQFETDHERVLRLLKEIRKGGKGDIERMEGEAHNAVCDFLISQGYLDIVDTWDEIWEEGA